MNETHPSSKALVIAAWLLVGLPLAWGVYRSSLNAAKLFKAPPAATGTTAPTAK